MLKWKRSRIDVEARLGRVLLGDPCNNCDNRFLRLGGFHKGCVTFALFARSGLATIRHVEGERMTRLKCFLAILTLLCLSACSDDKTRQLQQQVAALSNQLNQVAQLMGSLTNQMAHTRSDLLEQVILQNQDGAAARSNASAPDASESEVKGVNRFQLFYAPFPLELDHSATPNSGMAEKYDRLFLIDGKTGKVYYYSPWTSLYSGVSTNSFDQGFVALPSVENVGQLPGLRMLGQ